MASNPPASRAPSGQSFFQKKELGLPVWAWALIGVGAAGALYLYMRSRSTSSAATPAALPVSTSTGSGGGGFGVGGYGGSGIQPGAPMQPASPPAPASPGNPSLPFQVQSGSGWWAGGSNWATDSPQQQQAAIAAAQAAGPITDAAGNEYEWIDPQEYQSIQGSGIQVYYEVLPGVFVPVPQNMGNLAPGTPLYMQVPSGTPAGNTGAKAVPMTAASAGSTPQGT